MKNILVPTDFSETSRNAANFAARMAADLGSARILLYNVFESFEAGSDSSPLLDDLEDRRAIRLMALEGMKKEIDPEGKLAITCRADDSSSLVGSIRHTVASEMIDLVVVGITGATRLEQILIGSNTLRLMRSAICPVLVIPPKAGYTSLKRLALAADFNKKTSSLPWPRLRAVFNFFKPELFVVHVNSKPDSSTAERQRKEKEEMRSRLEEFNPLFFEVQQENFLEGINDFVADQAIDLLLTVPARLSFVQDLFRFTHTERLGYHSHVPFIAIPE